MSYCAMGISDTDASVWAANTSQWGAPIWWDGYWFWDQAGITANLVCMPFSSRSEACSAWASEDVLPAAKVPPFLLDASVDEDGLPQADIDRARQWIINPQLRNAGKTLLSSSGAPDGKLYWGAMFVNERRVVMPYDQAKIIFQIILWGQYNNVTPLDPDVTNLLQIPELEALKMEALKTATTPEGEPQPFWQNPMVLAAVLGVMFVVMAKKRKLKRLKGLKR